MMRASLLQIDKDDVRIIARPVEHDLSAVRRNVEPMDVTMVAEPGELARGVRRQIEQPEIWPRTASQIHQALTAWEEAMLES
jgi:hypothetical protein